MKIENTSINLNNLGEVVTLYGWVSRVRNLGGLLFIDLRDRSGIIQLVVKPDNKYYDVANTLKSEYTIKASGNVIKRESANKNLLTGDIEVDVTSLEVLSKSLDLPFTITDSVTASEETRLKYRYLDIRRNPIKNNLMLRSDIMYYTREFLHNESFCEIETPVLCKSTPEGARDYLVPSRIYNGSFYALPQSPQLFKQLLMVGGIEKYYQIAKCFRDEDLRADRQPEFTQIDMEMSFVDESDVMDVCERLVAYIFKKTKNIDIKLPLMRMKYDDAINDYGSDKPDLRYDLKINDITDVFKGTEISMFKDVINTQGIVNAIVVKNNIDFFSRKELDNLTLFVKGYGAKGLASLKFGDEVSGSIAKLISDKELKDLKEKLSIETGDVVLIVCDTKKVVKSSLGALRCNLANKLDLIGESDYKLLWVTDFPTFEWSDTENRFMAMHHPFTAPKDNDVDKLLTDKENCYSKAYDIVINGYEAGGGSIRIHDEKIQEKVFKALELTDEQVKNKFGFFVDALKYGAPPHGGLAIGLDRLTMILAGTTNIKDVIAFPKTTSASCLMSECPNVVDNSQLKELGIEIVK